MTARPTGLQQTINATAQRYVATTIWFGVRALIREPWRAERIIPGASRCDIDMLRLRVQQRSRKALGLDLNRALALRQLAAAIEEPEFAAAWNTYRQQEHQP